MSSEELFQLAEARKKQEKEAEKSKQKISELREERRKLVARQKKELAEFDGKIKALGGRSGGGRPAGAKRSSGNVAESVLQILQDGAPRSTNDIRDRLAKSGVVAGNLNQTLAYLKRKERIKGAGRATYVIVK